MTLGGEREEGGGGSMALASLPIEVSTGGVFRVPAGGRGVTDGGGKGVGWSHPLRGIGTKVRPVPPRVAGVNL